MSEVKPYKGISMVHAPEGHFVKRAMGKGKTARACFTIHGKRSPALGGRYAVLVESQGKTVFQKAGSLPEVRGAMEDDEHAEEGKELLSRVEAALSDRHTMSRWFTDMELICFAFFMEGPKTLVQLEMTARMPKEKIVEAMTELIAENFICEGESSSLKRYQLSEKGEQCVETMTGDSRFMILRRRRSGTV